MDDFELRGLQATPMIVVDMLVPSLYRAKSLLRMVSTSPSSPVAMLLMSQSLLEGIILLIAVLAMLARAKIGSQIP